MTSVFAKYTNQLYSHRFSATIVPWRLVGGIPSEPKVAEAWLRKKLGEQPDDMLREEVAKVMVERGLEVDDATDEVIAVKHLNGFKRDEHGLYIEGRQIKAALKEAANIRWPKREGWGGIPRKRSRSFFAEHVFVEELRIHLGVDEPTDVQQRFVSTYRGTGIQYEEYVDSPELHFTIATDYDLDKDDWGQLWATAEQQGIGATRSMGFGTYEVTRWDRL